MIAWVIFPLILASVYEVFSRYVLNAPTIWAFELAYMAMGVHALMGAAFALRERSHVRIDIFYNLYFPEKLKALADTVGYVVLFAPVVTLISLGLWDYWIESYLSGETSGQSAWNPLVWPFRLTFFLGFALLGLQGIAEIIKCVNVLTGKAASMEASHG